MHICCLLRPACLYSIITVVIEYVYDEVWTHVELGSLGLVILRKETEIPQLFNNRKTLMVSGNSEEMGIGLCYGTEISVAWRV